MPRLAEMQRIGKIRTRHAGSVAQIDRCGTVRRRNLQRAENPPGVACPMTASCDPLLSNENCLIWPFGYVGRLLSPFSVDLRLIQAGGVPDVEGSESEEKKPLEGVASCRSEIDFMRRRVNSSFSDPAVALIRSCHSRVDHAASQICTAPAVGE